MNEISLNITEIHDTQAEAANGAKIIVVGVGGAGNNALNRIAEEGIIGAELIGANTDMQALQMCKAPTHIQLGEKLTKGLGAGANPEIGMKAAEESAEEIAEKLEGADMVIVTCGMGGGTGTGAAPVIAKIAKDKQILTVGVVTKPFSFEAKVRMRHALEGIDRLKQSVDTLFIVPNDNILKLKEVNKNTSMTEALRMADEVLQQTVRGITDIIMQNSLINADFSDIDTVMRDKGVAYVGMGFASGENRAEEAIKLATSSPLLEADITAGATHALVYLVGNVTIYDQGDVNTYLLDQIGEDVLVITSMKEDRTMEDQISVTVIITGMKGDTDQQKPSLTGMAGFGRGSVLGRGGVGSSFASRPTATVSAGAGTTAGSSSSSTASSASSQPTLDRINKPSQPESTVPQMDIKIPAFLKNSKK